MYTEAEIKELLAKKNLFPSYHRIKILKYISEIKGHPTAEDIFIYLSKEIPTLSRSTIYNNLNALTASGLIKKLHIGDEARYELAQEPHAHLICEKCGKVYDIPLGDKYRCIYESLKELTEKEGHDLYDIEINIRGICRECLSKREGE